MTISRRLAILLGATVLALAPALLVAGPAGARNPPFTSFFFRPNGNNNCASPLDGANPHVVLTPCPTAVPTTAQTWNKLNIQVIGTTTWFQVQSASDGLCMGYGYADVGLAPCDATAKDQYWAIDDTNGQQRILNEDTDPGFVLGTQADQPDTPLLVRLNATDPFGAQTWIVSGIFTQLPVPDLIGESQALATQSLTTFGFSVGTITRSVDPTCTLIGTVKSEDPGAGTLVDPGTAVNLVIWDQPPTPCP